MKRHFSNLDDENFERGKMWRRDAGNYVDKHCTITL
jgi:hypothetical protein